ncbi:MAG: hypothetical protein ACYC0V_05735 [Armatimonadota bacterium]
MIRIEKNPKVSPQDYWKQKELYETTCLYKGKHFTLYMDDIKQLIKENNLAEAESLLLSIIDVVEAASRIPIPHVIESPETKYEILYHDVPPGWYERLAIIYRKQTRYADEVALIERYLQQEGTGTGRSNVTDRYEKAKQLLEKSVR